MDSASIRNELLNSASNYYQWIIDNDKSRIKIQVQSITLEKDENSEEDNYYLILKQNCADVDFVLFILYDYECQRDEIEVVDFDGQKRMKIKPHSDKATALLRGISASSITVINDLSFLIKRVRDWYKSNGDRISFSSSKPHITANVQCLSGSDEQKEAVSTAISNNISYIWGAPGTGKTQFVLANILIAYLNENQHTIVTSPTNTALEQTMYGVMNALRSNNIKDKDVFRLGMASSKFAWAYPECCEHDIAVEWLTKKKDFYIYYTAIRMLEEQREEDNYAENLKRESQLQRLQDLQTQLADIKKSFTRRVFRFQQINRITEEIQKLEQELESEVAVKRAYIPSELLVNVRRYILKYSKNEKFRNLVEAANTVDELTEIVRSRLSKTHPLDLKHETMSIEELKNETEYLRQEFDRVGRYDDAHRINEADIVAATLDKYIAAYNPDEKFIKNCSHAFIDEAGYTCLAKAFTILGLDCPVTLLGDHLQLPPVCEAPDKIIEENHEFFPWDQSAIYMKDLMNADTFNDAYVNYTYKKPPTFNKGELSILTSTFRFGPKLASVLDKYVYKFGFNSLKNSETGIFFIHAAASQSGRENIAEVYAIQNWLHNNKEESLAVITPYRNQVKALKNICGLSDDQAMTIHKSQGKEWDTVVFSVSDTTNMLFTDSTNLNFNGLNLINTAVSRAKKRLIIVCDKTYWQPLKDTQFIGALVDVATEI